MTVEVTAGVDTQARWRGGALLFDALRNQIRAKDVLVASASGHIGHGKRWLDAFRAIVQSPKNMRMDVDHAGLSSASRARHRALVPVR